SATSKVPEFNTTPPENVLLSDVNRNSPTPPSVNPVLPAMTLVTSNNVLDALLVLMIPSLPKFMAGTVTATAPLLDTASAPDNSVKVPLPTRLFPEPPLVINKAFNVCGTIRFCAPVILTMLPAGAIFGLPPP